MGEKRYTGEDTDDHDSGRSGYTSVFDDLFDTYTDKWELSKVKTTNMGSLFKLTYQMTLKDSSKEKEMIDGLRVRNGNLEIMISNQENVTENL